MTPGRKFSHAPGVDESKNRQSTVRPVTRRDGYSVLLCSPSVAPYAWRGRALVADREVAIILRKLDFERRYRLAYGRSDSVQDNGTDTGL